MCTIALGTAVPRPKYPSSEKRANSKLSVSSISCKNRIGRRALPSKRDLIRLLDVAPTTASVVENAKPVNLNAPPLPNSISPFTTSFVLSEIESAVERCPPITTVPPFLPIIHNGTLPVPSPAPGNAPP